MICDTGVIFHSCSLPIRQTILLIFLSQCLWKFTDIFLSLSCVPSCWPQAVENQHNLLRSLLCPLGSMLSAYAVCPIVGASPPVVVTTIEKGMLFMWNLFYWGSFDSLTHFQCWSTVCPIYGVSALQKTSSDSSNISPSVFYHRPLLHGIQRHPSPHCSLELLPRGFGTFW